MDDTDIMRILEAKGRVQVFSHDHRPFTTGKSNIKTIKNAYLYVYATITRLSEPDTITSQLYRWKIQAITANPALVSRNIDVLVDLFCGGGNVGINTSAERIVLNDSDKNVIRIFRLFRQYPTEQILEIIDGIIDRYGLSDSRTNGYAFYQCESARGLGTYNKEGYNRLRSELNNMKRRNDRYFFMLFTLIVFAFNNQIRFNEKENSIFRWGNATSITT